MGELTCWTLIRDAGAGDALARAQFAVRYESVTRAYLLARWGGSRLSMHVDDAIQDVFFECFRDGGILGRADSSRPGGFRAFFYGAVRRIAQRVESGRRGAREERLSTQIGEEELEADDERLSQVYDRAWAQSILRQAATRLGEQARSAGGDAPMRFELLRLRFQDGLAIHAIAERWRVAAAGLHHAYSKARTEYKAALVEVVLEHSPVPRAEGERQAERLLDLVG